MHKRIRKNIIVSTNCCLEYQKNCNVFHFYFWFIFTASFPSTSAVLQRVVQHEIGHYLNFNHHGGPVMTAGYNKRSNPPTLGSQDRNQLRDQFGKDNNQNTKPIIVDVNYIICQLQRLQTVLTSSV